MHATTAPIPVGTSRLRRFLDFSLVRLVIAFFTTALAGGLTSQFVSDHASGVFRHGWPSLCGSVAALAAYALYVQLIERRPVAELATRPAAMELGLGLAGGAALVAAVVGVLAVLGVYRFEAIDWAAPGLVAVFFQMVFVGTFEELLTRAVVFRLAERSLGTWAALAISSILFGLAHLPGSNADALAIAVTMVAGVFLGAAYLATRRLWLCMALHIGWNFTLGSLFSISVSGHERTVGLTTGSLAGPDWLTGGSYGLEGSVVTLVALLGAGAWLLHRAVSRGHVIAWASRETRRA